MPALTDAFDPELFRRQAHELVDHLADYLRAAFHGDMPVLPQGGPDELVARWSGDFSADGGAPLGPLLASVIAQSTHLHHPGYVGHQVTAPLPAGALCDLVSSLLNNGTAVFEMGPVSTAMERACTHWLAAQVGLGEEAEGVFTSGGSLGNLTALLAMRQAKAPFDIWREGAGGGPPLCVLASEQVHYSVRRAVQIMGWGVDGAYPVRVDARYRLCPEALGPALRAARARGRQVIGVVASAGSTATGAFDPLEPLTAFCEEHGLWLHVDGAHGASAALSPRYRHLLAGLEHADSLVWDAHKMMLMPALLTSVLFRHGLACHGAFSQEASYLYRAADPRNEWFNTGTRTFECTKSMMVLKLYAALCVYGTRMLGNYVTRMFELGGTFGAMLEEAHDFELATRPEANIVCFRYTGPSTAVPDDTVQERVRQEILQRGAFYLTQTRLGDRGVFLRTTLINPTTTEQDLERLMEAIRAAAGAFTAPARTPPG